MYEASEAENKTLNTTITDCEEKINNYKTTISELQKKIDNLQLIEAFKNSSTDVNEAKKRVASLIKEINKCISLLNN